MLNLLVEAVARLFRGAGALPDPRRIRLDPCLGDAEIAAWNDQLATGRWEEVHEALTAVSDPGRLERALDVLSDRQGRPRWLEQWAAARPDSALPVLLRGMHSIRWAWEARGGGMAKQVDAAAWPLFFERLELAMEDLQSVVEREPGNAVAWAAMLPALRGLQRPVEDARAAFGKAVAICPTLYGAHWQLLLDLCAKWGGSHALMFGFAREVSDAQPPGSPLHMLIPMAHLERWRYFGMQDDRAGMQAYFDDRTVRDELIATFKRFASVRSSVDYRDAANAFAMAFYFIGDRQRTAEALARTAGMVSRIPWNYADEPLKGYRSALAWVQR